MRVLFLIAMLVVGLLPRISIAQEDNPQLEYVDCPFDMPSGEDGGETIDCAVITVPESRAGLSDGEIELALIALYPPSGEEKIAPILYLAGGPGNSGTAMLYEFADDPIRDYTTIILLDQRGTGYSLPSLNCPEEDSDDAGEAEIQACYDRLVAEGILLGAYTTTENAADVNEVIEVLGLESVNLYGISYGTRLALTVMKNPHPAIRAVILDGVYPPDIHAYEEDYPNIAAVFDLIFTECGQDTACNRAFPDLEAVFISTMEDIEANPLIVAGEELYADDFLGELFSLLYDAESIPYIPALIYAAHYRDVESLQLFYESETSLNAPTLVRRQAPENDGNSEGMFYSGECADEVPFNTVEGITAQMLELELPENWTEALLAETFDSLTLCDIWVVPSADSSIRQATISDIPTLIFNGQYDAVTAPHWGEHAAQTLDTSYVFTIPAGAHGVANLAECPLDIAYAFLLDPYSPLDGSCIEAMPAPQWFVDYP